MKRIPLNQPNYSVRRERDHRSRGRLALLLLAGLVLTVGFIFAAGQRVTAVRYGYESEKLRLERQHLLEEQRRLMLAREEATTPSRLESAAKRIGMQKVEPSQVETQNRAPSKFAPATVTGGPATFER